MSFIDIKGRWDNGLPLAFGVPIVTATTIHVPQGGDVTVRLYVVDNNNTPIVTTTATVQLRVKKQTTWAETLLKKDGVPDASAGQGRWQFTIARNDLRFVEPGRYVFDVWMTKDLLLSSVIDTSLLLLEPTTQVPP